MSDRHAGAIAYMKKTLIWELVLKEKLQASDPPVSETFIKHSIEKGEFQAEMNLT